MKGRNMNTETFFGQNTTDEENIRILEKYPFVVFLPSEETSRFAKLLRSARGEKELLLIRISYSSILSDVVNDKDNCIKNAIDIINNFTHDKERLEVAVS